MEIERIISEFGLNVALIWTARGLIMGPKDPEAYVFPKARVVRPRVRLR